MSHDLQPKKPKKIAPPRIDYTDAQKKDIGEVHGAILREKVEPREGMEAIPFGLWIFFAFIIFGSGFYLGAYSAGFNGNVFDPALVTYGPVKAKGPVVKDPITDGRKVFTQNCAVCHQPTGLGIAGQYPPLAGSEVVLAKDGYGQNHIVLIVLKGLTGPVKIQGNLYNGNMQTWESVLKDEDIANVITYVRNSWGNKGGVMTKEYVASIRAKLADKHNQWSEAELRAVPSEAAPAATPPTPAQATPATTPATNVVVPKKS